jgi:transcriptional regulator with XRE-family HTH domain
MSTTTTLDRVLDQLASELGVTEPQLAGALGVTPRTLERWRAGERYPQHESRKRLDALMALHERLQTTFLTPEAISTWTHSNNVYLGGLKPADALQVGRIDAVDAALEALDSGIFL